MDIFQTSVGARGRNVMNVKRATPVTATVHIRKMRGESQSHLILCDDSSLYVVKFFDNPQHPSLVANEWFASHLADILNLPVPSVEIVNITDKFLRESPQLTKTVAGKDEQYHSGLHYGSRFAGALLPSRSAVDYLPSTLLHSVSNRDAFLGALVFDKWTCNIDARQAVFVPSRRGAAYTAHFIDHGACFNAEAWVLKSAPLNGCYGHRAIYASVNHMNQFEPWLDSLGALDLDAIWKCWQYMPEEWYLTRKDEGCRLIEALHDRRYKVERVLLEMIEAHPGIFAGWKTSTALSSGNPQTVAYE